MPFTRAVLDIYKRLPHKAPTWIESASQLSTTQERMNQRSAYDPGRHFRYNPQYRTVGVHIGTTAEDAQP